MPIGDIHWLFCKRKFGVDCQLMTGKCPLDEIGGGDQPNWHTRHREVMNTLLENGSFSLDEDGAVDFARRTLKFIQDHWKAFAGQFGGPENANAEILPECWTTHLVVDCASDFFWKIHDDEIDAKGFMNYSQIKSKNSGLEYVQFVVTVHEKGRFGLAERT